MGLEKFFEANHITFVMISFGLAVVACAAALFMLVELRRLRKPYREMADLHKSAGTDKALEKLLKGVDENREYIRGQAEEIKRIFHELTLCYKGTGIVKYNAFEDIGGMQSYSLCLLTPERNGIIMTNLVGRNSTRGYALEVKEGEPSRALSDEEKEALGYALRSLE